jgi:protein TonB
MPRPLGSKQLPVDRDVILPRVVSRSNPVYGEQSRKAGIEGTILLYVVVGTDGRPSDVLVFRPLSPDLNTEAVRSVRKWRFSAGTKNGLPVAVPMLVEINFQLAKL